MAGGRLERGGWAGGEWVGFEKRQVEVGDVSPQGFVGADGNDGQYAMGGGERDAFEELGAVEIVHVVGIAHIGPIEG